ncbi:hypothetical protein ACPPVO_21125 [Dactylosporangium sp. McL0621]|uniref:hypothetical protein n=1 Tax=Dactylosporangium sp. McL0621 TaxID=3415678 RepID=UPI003CEED178
MRKLMLSSYVSLDGKSADTDEAVPGKDQFFAGVRVPSVDCGHFVPLERPEDFAAAGTTAA